MRPARPMYGQHSTWGAALDSPQRFSPDNLAAPVDHLLMANRINYSDRTS